MDGNCQFWCLARELNKLELTGGIVWTHTELRREIDYGKG
jgi:hypothetical protein